MCHHTSLADALLRISTLSPWIFVCFMNKAIRKDRTELKGTMGFTGTDDSVMSKCIEYGMFINFGAGKRCKIRVCPDRKYSLSADTSA